MILSSILIVDNDPHTTRTLSATLKLELPHIHVHTSDSAVASLERIRAIEYEAIISEINMPHKNGPGFLRAVQKLRPETPVLFMTSHREHTLAIQSLAAGAYDVITKPIDRGACLVAVRHAIEAYRLRRQLRTQAGQLLDTLKEAVEDLEVLYGAYGLGTHFEAILQMAHGHLSSSVTPGPEAGSPRTLAKTTDGSYGLTEEQPNGPLVHFPLSSFSR